MSVRVCVALAGSVLCLGAGAGETPAAAAPKPFTVLFDTRSHSPAALLAERLGKPVGWTAVAEGDLAHKFAGDAVFRNDRIAVVLRKHGPGAEIYSRAASGLERRALLTVAGPGIALAGVRIVENGPGAVMVSAAFRTVGGRGASVALRITAGEAIVEARAGEGAAALLVHCDSRYVVVPDFFGDDMVFGPREIEAGRLGLPAENQFLSLVKGGSAIVMCLWESNELNADLLGAGAGKPRAIGACRIECAKGKKTWLAFLEAPGLWHARPVAAGDTGRDIVLDWQAPFPAKWRCSFVREGGLADTWDFRPERQPNYVHPEYGQMAYPCWLQGSRAAVRLPDLPKTSPKYAGPIIVYALDRSRATPLTVFCPIDVLRNALGTGPCEYVLAAEGLGSDSPATPDAVTGWIEKQFKRKRDKRASEEIGRRLGRMMRHMDLVRARIREYGRFAARVGRLCKAAPDSASAARLPRRVRAIVDKMARDIALGAAAQKARGPVGRHVASVVLLVGKEGAWGECERLGERIRALGAIQDRTLARCRMGVRRVKQQCRTTASDSRDAKSVEFARAIREQAEQFLRKK